jgi:hypothetical protein
MRSAHRNLDLFLSLGDRLGRGVVFISEETASRGKDYEWIPSRALRQIAFQLLTMWEMTREALRARRTDLVFIFEHKPWYAYPLYAVCLLRRQTVFFIVHGIQQTHGQSPFHRLGLQVLRTIEKHCEVWPIHLEISDQDVQGVPRFTKSIVVPLPLPREAPIERERSRQPGAPLRIGILGILRADKPVEPLLDILQACAKARPNVQLAFGSPRWQVPERLQQALAERGIEYADTDQPEQYNVFVHSLDIVVAWFERDSFYFRPSGILNDAIAGGCFVVAPDYPVLSVQMCVPARCGEPCPDLAGLPQALERAIDQVLHEPDLPLRFDAWRAWRADERVVQTLCSGIQNALAQGASQVQPGLTK